MRVSQSNDHHLEGPTTEYTPTESVKYTINDILSIIENAALKQPGQSEERRNQIEQVIRHRITFGQMAQRSLGTYWTALSYKEREEFVTIFVELMRDRLANKIDEYFGEQIFYLSEQREGSFSQVHSNLIGPKVNTSLQFRLENESGKWLVYDVVINGISTVENYRAQFTRIIDDATYAGLVEKMKQRAYTVKSFEKTVPAIAMLPIESQ